MVDWNVNASWTTLNLQTWNLKEINIKKLLVAFYMHVEKHNSTCVYFKKMKDPYKAQRKEETRGPLTCFSFTCSTFWVLI